MLYCFISSFKFSPVISRLVSLVPPIIISTVQESLIANVIPPKGFGEWFIEVHKDEVRSKATCSTEARRSGQLSAFRLSLEFEGRIVLVLISAVKRTGRWSEEKASETTEVTNDCKM